MARYTESACRLCRRQNLKLFLKGDRCYSDKCAYDRRNYAPGQHGQRRGKLSDYGIQLREKQKVKRMYGLLEAQFRAYVARAERQRGITGTNLLVLLERRLDNVVYRLGFAYSRQQARQLVRHRHFIVNGQCVDIPSYSAKTGDVIQVKEKGQKIAVLAEALNAVDRRGIPQWLDLDKGSFKGMVKALPVREDIIMPIQEQLIVELYSR
ncbi:MAG: 30S ribosomal protein S4 [Pseudomonadota bacterium]